MKQTHTVRDTVQCPKCDNVFTTPRHTRKGILSCYKCSWSGDFVYLTKPEEE